MEKYSRSGRHWELLQILESEGLASTRSHEYGEAWKAVIDKALKHEAGFDQLRREIGALKSLPENRDLRFLILLAGYLEDRNTAEAVLELKGLSPDAEKLRSRFAGFVSSGPTGDKLRPLLLKFTAEPDLVSRRHYLQLAGMLHDGLGDVVGDLGELINRVRRHNQKKAVSGGWEAVSPAEFRELDGRLCSIAGLLPPALEEVVLHPFVCNIAQLCRRLAPGALLNQASHLLGSMPFLLPRLAGERLEEVQRKLALDSELEDDDEEYSHLIARRSEKLGIEEKLTLLSRLRFKIRNLHPSDIDSDFLDVFDDGEDDNVSRIEETVQARELTGGILSLYQRIFDDIAVRYPGLSSREQKELVTVMEPVLLADLQFCAGLILDENALMELLNGAMQSGCAGTHLTLLTVLISSHYRNGELRRRTEKYLDQLAAPTEQEIQWLAAEWAEYYYPGVRSLKPLLSRYEKDEALTRIFADAIRSHLEVSLCESLVLADFAGYGVEALPVGQSTDPKLVRRELDALPGYKALDSVRAFLRCYADDRFTLEGHLCWLNTVHASHPEEAWQMALDEIRRGQQAEAACEFPLALLYRVIAEKREAVQLFAMEHAHEFAALPTDILGPLLSELTVNLKNWRKHMPFLIRLEKLIVDRVTSGDTDARPVMEKVRNTLQKLAKNTAPKTSGRKRRK